MNLLTRHINTAVNILFLGHPIRTALGFVLGVAFRLLLKVVSLWIDSPQMVGLSSIPEWSWGLLGVLILHIPTIRFYLFNKVSYLSENEEKAFAMIRDLKLPETHKQLLYLQLVEKVLERVEIKPDLTRETKNRFR